MSLPFFFFSTSEAPTTPAKQAQFAVFSLFPIVPLYTKGNTALHAIVCFSLSFIFAHHQNLTKEILKKIVIKNFSQTPFSLSDACLFPFVFCASLETSLEDSFLSFSFLCVNQGTTTRKRDKLKMKRSRSTFFPLFFRLLSPHTSRKRKKKELSPNSLVKTTTMLASTAPLRAATTSMPRAVSRPAGLTVEAKWKVRLRELREEGFGETQRKIFGATQERRSHRRRGKDRALARARIHPAPICTLCYSRSKADIE